MPDLVPYPKQYPQKSLAWGVIAGVALDRLLGDPGGRWHPVAIFGRYAQYTEKRLYRPNKKSGAVFVAVTVLPPVILSSWVARRAPRLMLAASLFGALGGTTLEKTGMRMARALAQGDISTARSLVPWLCSRDPDQLDKQGIARATVESLAENTSDATIAPLFWSIFGAPAVVGHRCVNTLDAMVGYKNERYSEFGWAAAKLDDTLAYVPARVTAVAHVVAAAMRGRGRDALRAWREDAPQHPSPNAGPVEATAAAAMGVQLGGATQYPHGIEMRPVLGTGPAPSVETITTAVSLSRWTQILVALAVVALQQVASRARVQRGRYLND
ncbi:adenosylcobinamide-phosphate synthase CbiB [Corynebacterium pseudotuberculosis]|uniref:adenosylcobinamide-phosphate synthase CbiB n=2 Tax=Corynebacterium pseudotuberculosis TaxID=1719 RepID=UPI00090C963C|nr:adenosylcobinamide-phosphate synthase CbiB [Corynebacterium pseudotuberculosis]APG82191.1 Cobalamin biosynthesis protein CobD [Corynebacterium pseudotuberculosis]